MHPEREGVVKFDMMLVTDEYFRFLLRHSISQDGIWFASLPLLLAQKVQSFVGRRKGHKKIGQDFSDIRNLAVRIARDKITFPEEITRRLLSPDMMRNFYKRMVSRRDDVKVLQAIFDIGAMPEVVAEELLAKRVLRSSG